RNHFTDLQWIPNNIENGYMNEFTYNVVPASEVKIAEALINFPGWLRSHKINQIVVPNAPQEERQSRLEELHSLAGTFSTHIARVPYVEISRILARPSILNKIPSGAVVNFV